MECVTGKCVRPGSPAGLESLEPRRLMSASGLSDPGPRHGVGAEFVYVESNNPQPGQNAVIALRRNPSSGALQRAVVADAEDRDRVASLVHREQESAVGTGDDFLV